MVSSRIESVGNKGKSKEKRLKPKKTKSMKSTSSGSAATITTKESSKRNEDEETGGLKLLKRHAVTMSRITRRKSRKIRRTFAFTRKGIPYGKVAKEMQSYIGVLARRNIPIIRKNWRKVTDEEKEKIWRRIQIPFVLGPENKKIILESACTKWREFKSRLTSNYIIPYVNDPGALLYPPDDYRFIQPDHWTQFVQNRTTAIWLAKRAAQQDRRAKNKYPHRLSRKGYVGLEQELVEETGEEEIPRHTLWVKAREGKDGSFKDDDTKQKAQEIEVLKKRVAEGEVVEEGSNDILTMALETPEHGGRVRGVGGFVTPSTYFHLPKRRRESIEATVRVSVQKILEEEKEKLIREIRQQIREEEREKMREEERAKLEGEGKEKAAASPVGNHPESLPRASGMGSCSYLSAETKQCGYFVMRFMRDIIEDKELSLFATKWLVRGTCKYSQEDIDEVRNEWAKFVLKTYSTVAA